MVGRAMHLLRHPKDANRAFNESERAERARVGTQTAPSWRDAALARRALPRQVRPGRTPRRSLNEALKIAPHRADAIVMLARVKLEESFDFDAAEKLVERGARGEPEARRRVRGARRPRAARHGPRRRQRARSTPGSRSIRTTSSSSACGPRRASSPTTARLRGGQERASSRATRSISRAYGIIGEYAEWEHRYDDIVAMMKEAVALDPEGRQGVGAARADADARGRRGRGRGVARGGVEGRPLQRPRLQHARDALHALDPEAVRGEGRRASSTSATRRTSAPILERYVPRMLGEAWGSMKVHYMFAPAVPVHVEIYASREHFSVRTSGLPNIGIQGVCFGHVVAAMSPESEPFNWGNVLWHELGHVFAIQLSKNHVPRWFTEGLSEYETMIRRPGVAARARPRALLGAQAARAPGRAST